MLDLLLLSPTEHWWRKEGILKVLRRISSSLGSAQRQKWVDVLTKLLKQEDGREKQELIISRIEICYLLGGREPPEVPLRTRTFSLKRFGGPGRRQRVGRKALLSMRFPRDEP